MSKYNNMDFIRLIRSSATSDLGFIQGLVSREIKRRLRPSELEKKNGELPLDFKKLTPTKGKPLKPLPNINAGWRENINYLACILQQDWSFLFRGTDNEKKGYYVYAHVTPSGIDCKSARRLKLKGVPFYIGKGIGQRAYDLNRNQGHGAMLRNAIREGFKEENIVNIILADLTERQALELESKLIYFFGTKYEPRRKGGVLVNLDIEKRPIFGLVAKNTIIRRPTIDSPSDIDEIK
jgi:hypothetical protein